MQVYIQDVRSRLAKDRARQIAGEVTPSAMHFDRALEFLASVGLESLSLSDGVRLPQLPSYAKPRTASYASAWCQGSFLTRSGTALTYKQFS